MTGLANTPLGVELLDDPAADPAIVRSSLSHIARSNRWLGGRSAMLFGLGQALSGVATGSPITLLDVGTGAGDLPLAAQRWGSRRGIRIQPLGLDLSLAAARLARENGIPAVAGCGGSLPLRNQSVDVVLVSQVIHHLRRDAAVTLLRECDRIARIAVVVTDLNRARMAMAGFWLVSRLLQFDPATRADGLTSVRRGYSPAEFRRLFVEAGLPARCHRRPGYRLVAIWRTG
jgi:2-polyprenyl-3-methyl-5-hydroxy-6-metoxy-1,4-benzoquinol methylase